MNMVIEYVLYKYNLGDKRDNTEGNKLMLTAQQIQQRVAYLQAKYPDAIWKYSSKYNCVPSDKGDIAKVIKRKTGSDLYAKCLQQNGYITFFNTTYHKVIWETFNGDVKDGYEIDHIDNIKTNNALSNLQLLTHKENIEKRDANGNPKNVAIEQYDSTNNLVKTWSSGKEVAEAMAKTYASNISVAIKNGTLYKGYYWKKKFDNNSSDVL